MKKLAETLPLIKAVESVTECEPAFDLIIAWIDNHEENVVSIEI